MNGKERILTALEVREPDCVPLYIHGINEAPIIGIGKHLTDGLPEPQDFRLMNDRDKFKLVDTLFMIHEHFDIDGITTFARKAGFESVMMIPGHVHDELGQTPEEAFCTSVEELRGMVAVAGEKQLGCNIEPCVGSIAAQPADAMRLVEEVAGLGLTLDYAHQVQLGLGHEDIEVLHPLARHFHAKQSAPGAFQARPDEGSIDFGRLIRKLQADGYDGVICVEFVTQQELLDAGWDLQRETARLKQILEEALSRFSK